MSIVILKKQKENVRKDAYSELSKFSRSENVGRIHLRHAMCVAWIPTMSQKASKGEGKYKRLLYPGCSD